MFNAVQFIRKVGNTYYYRKVRRGDINAKAIHLAIAPKARHLSLNVKLLNGKVL